MNKHELTEVFADTERRAALMAAPLPSVKISHSSLPEVDQELKFKSNVICIEMDTFDAVAHYRSKGSCILNMASFSTSGGGVRNGTRAQEEDLFRKSNYCRTLTQDMYPLKKDELVWSPAVTAFKASRTYDLLKDPFMCSAIACAALRRPKLNKNGLYMYKKDFDCMEEKVEAIFRLAIRHKVKTLILSAFGCGAYLNPSNTVAKMMYNVAFKYSQHFDRIVFAVIGPNFLIFEKELNAILNPGYVSKHYICILQKNETIDEK